MKRTLLVRATEILFVIPDPDRTAVRNKFLVIAFDTANIEYSDVLEGYKLKLLMSSSRTRTSVRNKFKLPRIRV
jgi:hypothetical protein